MNLIIRLRALLRRDLGQDLLEYALLVALIALVAVAAVGSNDSGVDRVLRNISSQLTNGATR